MKNQTWSPVAVVGAGALGCYFGGVLARAGARVTLIGRRAHVEAINRDGLGFESRGRQQFIPVAATERIAGVADARLILFCVKSNDTDDAAAQMAQYLAPDAVVLSLQNGVDNVERIRLHLAQQVVPALVYAAAEMAAPGCVRHTGGGSLIIGALRGAAPPAAAAGERPLEALAAFLEECGIPVTVSDRIEVDLWSKLVMNCAYNAISALCGARYGAMVALPEVRAVMCEAVAEVSAVAAAKGIRLPDDIVDAAIRLADGMPVTVSSTAQDIRRGKRTEIDYLNGYVAREGKTLGIATPVNRALNALVKLLEQTRAEPAEQTRAEP
ncbi:MAG TPA: 2-dehydropantoate 2-reductase [Xanthobacteraceae bacterium]|nr:2-dehydropantoate 2-reductase [Xanthobacteraceae bacterium]